MMRAFLGCLVLIGLTAPGASQAPSRDNAARRTGTARIRGRVVESPGGRPLSRVDVRAGGPGGPQATALTDAEGRYELTDLPAGTYTVIATKQNYIRTAWGEQRSEGPGKRIQLEDGQALDHIDLAIKRGGVVTGRVVDEFGDPVTDVNVSAMRYAYVQGTRRLMPSGRGTTTNDIGEFRVYDLTPGQYFISATLRTFNAPGTETTDRTAYAPTFYPGTGNVAEAQRLTIAAAQTINGVNLTMLPIQTARITGTVLDAEGKPLAGAMIMVMQRISSMMIGGNVAPARADGAFTISNLTPGDYTLRANTPAGESASMDVTVTGADITNLQMMVAKPSTVRGRVVFTPSATGADPPKPNVIDMGAWRDWAIGQQVRSPAKIKDDGTFEISLAAGRVQLRAAPIGGAAATPAWRLNRVLLHDTDVGDTGIDVPVNGAIENVIVEMTNHSAEASGRVTDADGKTVRDCFVIVFAQDPVHWTVQTRYLSVARPGLDDLYHARLLAGDYFVVAMADVEANAWTDPEFLMRARERATKFSIADGEKKTFDLPLVPAPVF